MNANPENVRAIRWNAAIVGVLFIIATAAGSIAAAIGSPILEAPDYLSKIAANEGRVLLGAFLTFLMSVACAGGGCHYILSFAAIAWAWQSVQPASGCWRV